MTDILAATVIAAAAFYAGWTMRGQTHPPKCLDFGVTSVCVGKNERGW
jgi:hypothetical protein